MKRLIPTAVSILIIVILLYVFKDQYSESAGNSSGTHATRMDTSTLTRIGQPVPEFTFSTLNGDSQKISDLKGKVVLLNFFATWCPPCIAEMPHLEKEIWQQHKDQDFILLALGREQAVSHLDSFKTVNNYTFPVVADTGRVIFSKFATQNIPRNILLDKQGTIVFQSIGFEKKEFEVLKSTIAKLLN